MWWRNNCARADVPGTVSAAAAAIPAVVIAALGLAGCSSEAPVVERIIPVFGTVVQVDIAGTDTATADTALDRIEQIYRRIDTDWRAFGNGELGRANARLATGEPATLSAELAHIVARSLEIHRLTGGLFDPRVGPLIHLWGFGDLAHATPAKPPDASAIEAARAAIGAAVLHLDGTLLSTAAPVTLELAGIAKGSALAAGAAALRDAGIGNALIVAGGDVLAIGSRGARPWRIGVRDPLGPGVLGRIELADGEVAASSGNYERYFHADGQRFHHILDPRTGWPARGTAGTTVIGRDAELTNAAATALLVGGPAAFDGLTRQLGIDCALLVTEDGRRLATPCMEERLQR